MSKRVVLSCVILCVSASLCFTQTLKVDVNLINLFATVQDDRGNFITNLNKDDFRVYEDDEPQEIQVFEKNRVESSIGLLIDSSGSMVDILSYVRRGVRDFTRSLRKGDDFFVASFGASVRLLYDSSQPQKELESGLNGLRAWGTSVLFDSLLNGIARLERSANPRKALIVFTDGNENGSTVNHGRILERVQSSGVLLYFVALGSPVLIDSHTIEPLSDVSGGRTMYVPKKNDVAPILNQIREELSRQYYLAYYAPKREGFHSIRVEVPGRSYRIHSKTGYSN